MVTRETGGRFIIKDKQTLAGIGSAGQASTELLLESLKNYQYDKGTANLYLEDGNIVMRMFMDGPTGSRDLTYDFHDILDNLGIK